MNFCLIKIIFRLLQCKWVSPFSIFLYEILGANYCDLTIYFVDRVGWNNHDSRVVGLGGSQNMINNVDGKGDFFFGQKMGWFNFI